MNEVISCRLGVGTVFLVLEDLRVETLGELLIVAGWVMHAT
jgi:hypothetical protein